TASSDTSTLSSSWFLYDVATPCAAASSARSGGTVTREVLPSELSPNCRLAMRPRLRRFDLRGEPDQRDLVARTTDELYTDRQFALAVWVRLPVQGDRHGRLSAHV